MGTASFSRSARIRRWWRWRSAAAESDSLCLTSLRRGKDDWSELLASLAQLYVQGAAVDWAGVDRPYPRRRVALPTYPFEHRRFWLEPRPHGLAMSGEPSGHPLLGRRLPTAMPLFETTLRPDTLACLQDHRIHGAVLVPGPAFLELAQAAMQHADGPALRTVRDFRILEPLVLPQEGRVVQIQLGTADGDAGSFLVHSRAATDEKGWRLHAQGRLEPTTPQAAVAGGSTLALSATQDALGPASACDDYYARLLAMGIGLGPGFRSLARAHRGVGEALAWIELPAMAAQDPVGWAHPALLDGALQSIGPAVPESARADSAYLLTAVDRLDLLTPLPAGLWSHARVLDALQSDPAQWQAEVTLRSAEGRVVGVIQGVQLQRASRDALSRAAGGGGCSEFFHRLDWQIAPLKPPAAMSLVGPAEFAPALEPRFSDLAVSHGLSVYETLLPELDRLSADFVGTALHELGFDAALGRRFDAADEARRLGVADRHSRLFGRLLQMLVEDRVLRREDGQFVVAGALPLVDAVSRCEAAMIRFAPIDGELHTLRRCGPELARVLRGAQDPLQLLFPGGSLEEARKLYVESPYAQTYNRALGEALKAAIARLPEGSPLRVLEIGAGTGGTTTYVLPLLPAQRTTYTFTDLSPLFLERAAEQFAAFPFVRHALLDIERDPVEQGFEAAGFDIVIAANVLHATADLRRTLAHARRLMALARCCCCSRAWPPSAGWISPSA
ncbi:methyltransferase [Piscinibacter aquaticus]|uniref:Methyltransferase n=1 Tax=Piscinibacter aquaticus TaxID=392597 RepID=A0A5C6U304_9BURK|nr:methyltransferase [Piscinibacter aquaticus]